MTPKLSRGGHKPTDGQTCLMEYISVITGDMFTDLPHCTEPMVSYAAQAVNDGSSEEGRQRLLELVPRLIKARPLRSDGVAELQRWVMFASDQFYRSHKEDATPPPYQFFLDGHRRVAGFLAKDITIHDGDAAGFEFLTRLLDEHDRIMQRALRPYDTYPRYGYIDPRIEASMYAPMVPPTLSPAVLAELAAGHSVAAVAADEDK